MNLRKKALLASLMLIPSVASAAVPASVTAGVTEAVTDVGVIGAAVLGVIIVMAAFSWLRRMVK
ncbi:MAG: major capsid protein [Nitrosomonas sp.]|uniref:major capsid protein n=1 Tax=Nitrosomonas sp. TaxID=42353 RepID=UPI0027376B00|nr:major capsid protein [Nitrosomonas sp.]MDP3226261.1 major capsid protein [Rubrivivax sp.]MDP3662072.1 major capsid protein [Nitrosomonas sp.]MDZ4106501.1 major capsid protein [Nitrosomonas sp.]